MTEETKPSNCLCNFPEIKEATGSGHNAGCPAHKQWVIDNPPKQGKFRSTMMQADEDPPPVNPPRPPIRREYA